MNNTECSFLRRRTSVRNDAQTMTFARRYKKTRSVTCAADASPMRKSAQWQQIARSAVPPRLIWIWTCEGLWIRILSGDANRPPLFPQMRVWRVPGGFSVSVQTLRRWRVGHTHTYTHIHSMLLWLPACVHTVIWLLFACCCSSRCCSCSWGPIRVSLAVDHNPFTGRSACFIVFALSRSIASCILRSGTHELVEMNGNVSVYTWGKLSRGSQLSN